MSTSPNLLTKCSIRLRRICVVWEFINGAVTCTLNVTCTLDPAFKKRHFLGNFSQNSEKKNSKASYQTVPVTKSNLGLQRHCRFHQICQKTKKKLFHSQHGVSKIQRLQFYQMIPFFQYLYPNDHTRKDTKIQGI